MRPGTRSDAEVKVPRLVGLTVPEARQTGHGAGVVVTSTNLDGPPLGALTWPGTWMVTAQRPAAESRVRRGAVVVIEFEQDGGAAGDREPRRPLPEPDAVRAERDIPGETPPL